jgi:hypothetical protein
VKHRLVKLRRKRPGKDQTVAFDRANQQGDWKVKIPYPGARPGTYYAKAAKKKHKRYVCDKGRSSSIVVPAA